MSSIRKKSSKKSSVKKVLLKISQNSQENIFTRVSFVIKLQACRIFPHSDCIRRDTIRITPCLPLFIPNAGKCGRPAPLLKKRLWHRCFPVSFAKLLFLKKFLLLSVSKQAKTDICMTTQKAITAVWNFLKTYFFTDFFLVE